MKNNIYKFFTMLFVASTFYACENDLLNTLPYNRVGSEAMWTTESMTDLGLVGVYQTLRNNHVGLHQWQLDQYSVSTMNRDIQALVGGNITSGNVLFSDYWKQHYEGIHRANNAVMNIEKVSPLTPEKKGRLLAESKFLRAFFYFNLNQVYKGVPVYLEPVSLEQLTRGRETEDAVWEIIIQDLSDCINEPNFPDIYVKGNVGHGRASKSAAYALRGKAYMWLKKYSEAEADFKEVEKRGASLYQGEYKQLFKEANEQHAEMIFSVQNIGISGLGSDIQLRLGTRSSFGSCWNTFLAHPDFVESFENKDGSAFDWETYLPGYNSLTPSQRTVYFLRNNITESEIKVFESRGANMSLYLPNGNEERIRQAYENRDPRLTSLIITPYSQYVGYVNNASTAVTLRWPYRVENQAPFDLRTDSNTKFYYLWRKWVAEGGSEIPNRAYCPTDQPLIRYADVLLLLAEAINEQGFAQEAIDMVNLIRTRVGVPPLQSTDASLPTYVSTQENMRERIRNERRWELALEGQSFFDELRWGTWREQKFAPGNGIKEIWGTVTAPYSWGGEHFYKWAIPQKEIEMNRNIIQNEGWIN
ncbi:hypothetical protein AwDysgo_03090 [Bacteroidales bacterium]|nr:hypothetical protein AwDysgo_03090 [Bacteroidales bacterium]